MQKSRTFIRKIAFVLTIMMVLSIVIGGLPLSVLAYQRDINKLKEMNGIMDEEEVLDEDTAESEAVEGMPHNDATLDITDEQLDEQDPVRLYELEEEKTEYSDTYLYSDGTKEQEIYFDRFQYKDENDDWQEIDNSIVELPKQSKNEKSYIKDGLKIDSEPGYSYRNKSNNLEIYFADDIRDTLGVKMQDEDFILGFGLLQDEEIDAGEKKLELRSLEEELIESGQKMPEADMQDDATGDVADIDDEPGKNG